MGQWTPRVSLCLVTRASSMSEFPSKRATTAKNTPMQPCDSGKGTEVVTTARNHVAQTNQGVSDAVAGGGNNPTCQQPEQLQLVHDRDIRWGHRHWAYV